MADIVHTNQSQQNIAEEIDTNEVLRDYGLDELTQTHTIVQNGESTITIPESSNGLTPPPVDDTLDNDLDALANEMLNNINGVPETPATSEPAAVVSTPVLEANDAPFNLDEEEDMDWDNLEESGVIREVENNTESSDSAPLDTRDDGNPEETALATQTPEETENTQMLSAEEAIKLLPVNSLSYANDDTTSRFSGALWFHKIQESSILLAGLGGIGSYICFILSRMKPKQIFIYDDDVVEAANLSGQLYGQTMIGRHKVDAMADVAREFSCYYGIQAIRERFTLDTPAGDIMICGFDNMQARKDFFTVWTNHLVNHPYPERCLFIDGRLSMEEFQIFCMRGDDTFNIKRYHDEYLFEDYQAESLQCSMKQTTYCANMIGSVIVNLFTNFIANQLNPLIDRDLPFKTYYDAGMMFFKTEM